MSTSIVLVALAGLLGTSTDGDSPTWMTDYQQARKQGQTQQKPLAVVFGSGVGGQAKVCSEGAISPIAQKVLTDKYLCVYVDLATPAGKELATQFEITAPQGLVLSDRTGDFQAYSRNGDLGSTDLLRALQRFSDPNLAVPTTVTNLNARISYYPSDNGSGQPGVGVQYIQQFGGASYCPNCRR